MASNRWIVPGRRDVLRGMAIGAGALWVPGVFAEQLTRTAAQAEGPFYPDKLPLDTDNDLILVNDNVTPGLGEVTHLTGQVFSETGSPIRNAVIEIWQCDNNGVYQHSGSDNRENRDNNFQGYGRFLTDSQGRYYFRTIKPVPYPGRTPHIHFAVSRSNRRVLTTQMYINGHAQNERDGLLSRVQDPAARRTILVDFKPLAGSTVGELEASFNIVLGTTPAE